MRISDWSSDVCSSDLAEARKALGRPGSRFASIALKASVAPTLMAQGKTGFARQFLEEALELAKSVHGEGSGLAALPALPMAEMLYECDNTGRSEEHTSELQSLMRSSYAVCCLKKKKISIHRGIR